VVEAHKKILLLRGGTRGTEWCGRWLSIDEKYATQPSEVQDFVELTRCDSLAVAVGTSHGAYNFLGVMVFSLKYWKRFSVAQIPIVLHGGSAVNFEEIDRVNKAGGQL
jgi:fructose-bisphosphate aldolase class II